MSERKHACRFLDRQYRARCAGESVSSSVGSSSTASKESEEERPCPGGCLDPEDRLTYRQPTEHAGNYHTPMKNNRSGQEPDRATQMRPAARKPL